MSNREIPRSGRLPCFNGITHSTVHVDKMQAEMVVQVYDEA